MLHTRGRGFTFQTACEPQALRRIPLGDGLGPISQHKSHKGRIYGKVPDSKGRNMNTPNRKNIPSPLIGAEEWWGRTFLQEADERLDSYFSGIDDEAKGAERLLMFVVSAATVLALFTSSWGDYESVKGIFLYIALMLLFLLFLISVPRK